MNLLFTKLLFINVLCMGLLFINGCNLSFDESHDEKEIIYNNQTYYRVPDDVYYNFSISEYNTKYVEEEDIYVFKDHLIFKDLDEMVVYYDYALGELNIENQELISEITISYSPSQIIKDKINFLILGEDSYNTYFLDTVSKKQLSDYLGNGKNICGKVSKTGLKECGWIEFQFNELQMISNQYLIYYSEDDDCYYLIDQLNEDESYKIDEKQLEEICAYDD